MDVGILDLETSKFPAGHPWMTDSYISTIGLRMHRECMPSYYKEWVWYHNQRPVTEDDRLNIVFELQEEMDHLLRSGGLLVGHNIKFDMNWIKWFNVDVTGMQLWDTMVAEYMLRGQEKLPEHYNLSECCQLRGLPVKTDVMKQYWDAGRDTHTIPLTIVLPYMKNDIDITADLFKQQYPEMKADPKLYTLAKIRQRNTHILSDIEMNGMAFDKDTANRHVKRFQLDLERANSQLRSHFGRDDINMSSGPELSAGLYGGVLKRERYVPLVYTRNVTVKDAYDFTYASGKMKGMTVTKYRNRTLLELTCKKRKELYEVAIKGVGFTPPDKSGTAVDGVYQTNKDVLRNLSCGSSGGTTAKFKRGVLEILLHRSKIAQFTKSFVGTKENTGIFYRASLNRDGWVHPNYNSTIAATGRLTSSGDMNGQNAARAGEDDDGFSNPFKQCFVPSRPNGVVLVIDLSQLEWRVAAWMAQDKVAMAEIMSGVDQHGANAVSFFGDIKFRQAAKIMTFRLLYGGSAYAFFMDPQMPSFTLKNWNEIVSAYERKYIGIAYWQQQNILSVGSNYGVLVSPTGRRYTIPMSPHKKHPGVMVYTETCIKNYPVQGTATGDIVPLAMNEMDDRMTAQPEKFISSNWMGTVHDSLIFDTMPHEVKRVAMTGIQVFEDLPEIISNLWGVDFNLPLTGEATWGPTYGAQTTSVQHKEGQWILKKK